jgi:hypothetical protein
MYLQVALLSALALATLLVVRGIRGRTWLVDAVFPLVWLHTGNAENLLMGFSTSFVLPTVFASALILTVAARARLALGPIGALLAGLCLFAMPLCGGPGLVQTPALLAALIVATSWSFRDGDARSKRGVRILFVILGLTAALVAVYPVGLRLPPQSSRTLDLVRIGEVAARLTTQVIGDAGRVWWPWSGIGIAVLLAATVTVLGASWRSKRSERRRIAALACGLAASACLALSIGFGRGSVEADAGFSLRYIPLMTPLVVTVVCTWVVYGGRVGRWLAPGLLALAALVADVSANPATGKVYAERRDGMAESFEADIRSGMRPREVAAKWSPAVYPSQRRLHEMLARLARLDMAPFDRMPPEVRARWTWLVSSLEPTRIEPEDVVLHRWIDETWPAWLVPGGCRIHFEVPPHVTKLEGEFGMLDATVARGSTQGARARVLAGARAGEETDVLYERSIDPVHVESDRGRQKFAVTLKPGEPYVVLEMTVPEDAQREARWAYWSTLDFR